MTASNANGDSEDAREPTATLIGSSDDAMEGIIALWWQVTAQVMVQADGVPIEVDAHSACRWPWRNPTRTTRTCRYWR